MPGTASTEGLEYKYICYWLMLALGTKGAGGIGKIVCRIVVFIFINLFQFAIFPVRCFPVWEAEESLYVPKARKLALLEQ